MATLESYLNRIRNKLETELYELKSQPTAYSSDYEKGFRDGKIDAITELLSNTGAYIANIEEERKMDEEEYMTREEMVELLFNSNFDAVNDPSEMDEPIERLNYLGTVINNLSSYCENKRKAMVCRSKGKIQDALFWESQCESLYELLPENLKW